MTKLVTINSGIAVCQIPALDTESPRDCAERIIESLIEYIDRIDEQDDIGFRKRAPRITRWLQDQLE